MSDERIERELREALLRDDPGPTPPALRARVAAIPEEASARQKAPRSRHSRLLTAIAAAAAVVVVGAALVVGIGIHDATIGPPASATPSVAPSAPAVVAPASPSATTSPAAWAAVSSPVLAGMTMDDVVPFNGGFLALGTTSSPATEHVLTSPNGTDWARHEPIITPSGPAGLGDMAGFGSGIIAAGSIGYPCSNGRAAVFTSSDGIHWSAIDLPAPSTGQSFSAGLIAAGPAGYVVLGGYDGCVGGSGAIASAAPLNAPLLWHSTDGQHWTSVRFPESSVNLVTLVAGGPGFLIGGDRHVGSRLDAAIWTSRDGVTWTAANPLPDNQGMGSGGPMQVNAIAAGPDRILAISGRTGYEPQGRIWSSQDGITWQKVADLSASDPRVYRVAWTPAGFVMAALAGDTPGESTIIVRSSPDGASWTTLFSLPPASSAVSGIASDSRSIVVVGTSAQNGLVVAGPAAKDVAPTSAPSPTPTPTPSPPGTPPASETVGGFLWTRIDAPFGGAQPGPMTALGSQVVMATSPYGWVSPGTAMPHPTFWHSLDGSTWQRLPDRPAFAGVPDKWMDVVLGLTSNGSGLIAVGMQQYADASTANAEAWTSPDGGKTWNRASVADGTQATMNFVYRAGGGFVAIGTDGYSFHAGMEAGTAIWTSSDGTHWTRLPQSEVPAHVSISSVAYGNGRYVAVGQILPPGAMNADPAPKWISSDGIHFQALAGTAGGPSGDMVVRQIVWTGSEFVAVGDPLSLDAPTAWRSTNGMDWQPVELPHDAGAGTPGASAAAQSGVEGIAETPTGLVAVGAAEDTIHGTTASGMVWESSDGRSWQVVSQPTDFPGADLQSVSPIGGGRFVVEGQDNRGDPSVALMWTLDPATARP